METSHRRFPGVLTGSCLLLLAVPLLACSDSGMGPKKELAPFVGKWQAQSLVLTNAANPSVSIDLVQEGATFTLSVLSTGAYSASLVVLGQSNTELGTIEVSGNQVTITPTSPPGPPIVGTFAFRNRMLILDGESEYNFNQGEAPVKALVHIELFRLAS